MGTVNSLAWGLCAALLATAWSGELRAQKKPTPLREVEVKADRSWLGNRSLYEGAEALPAHIGPVYQLEVFNGRTSSEVWYSETPCLSVEQKSGVEPGSRDAVLLEWTKLKTGCFSDWMGLGIGWDNWAAKDLYSIVDSAALSFRLKPVHGSLKGLPLAVCFEDYAGKQAWAGLSPDRMEGTFDSVHWGQVVVPLRDFNWKEQNANPSNLKQLIVQFEAEGAVLLERIELIRRPAPTRKEGMLYLTPDALTADGLADPAIQRAPSLTLEGGEVVWIFANDSVLGLYAEWPKGRNGKTLNAIDWLISSNPEAEADRGKRLMSDAVVRVQPSSAPVDVRLNRALANATTVISETGETGRIEVLIPLKALRHAGCAPNTQLLFDVRFAYTANGASFTSSWNNPTVFEPENPQVWGFVRVTDESTIE